MAWPPRIAGEVVKPAMESETLGHFGRYRLVRRLGQGGMAEVYLGETSGPGGFRKRVAIKRLLPHFASNDRFVTMLQDEARIAAAIRHPHVAEVIDFGSVDGQHFIVMEYVDGVDLATVLRGYRLKSMLLPLSAALYIARAVAEGLHAAHQLRDSDGRPQEVIHRDVSPHNILLSYEGAVKLIDFGVAKAANNSTKTRSGVIKGKLQYMSPEQAQAQALDARADIFSLGMTLYKMLTGRLPFTGQNEYQVYDQILRKKPVPPRQIVTDLPPRVDAIVLKSLRKNRNRRFQAAHEMADLLDIALGEIDPEYGARELGELISAEMLQPGARDQLYEEDFIASADGEEGEPEVDDREVDRLTDVSLVRPSPEFADEATKAVETLPAEPARPRVVEPARPRVVEPAQPRVVEPAKPRVVEPASPRPVESPRARTDSPDASLDGLDEDGMAATIAIPVVVGEPGDEDPTVAVDPEHAGVDELLREMAAEEMAEAATSITVAPNAAPRRWLYLATAVGIGTVVGLVLAFTQGGEQTLPDEPPAKVRIGVGFDAAPPPPSEP
ncbi:MAG: protein kinase [Myxococcales bacterium]|nr:protein kinase [Myxococcales bacterium]